MYVYILNLQRASILNVIALDGDRGIPNDVNYSLLDGKPIHVYVIDMVRRFDT